MPQSWTCPFCHRPTTLTDNDTDDGQTLLFGDSYYGKVGIGWVSARCPNPDCQEVWLHITFNKWISSDRSYHHGRLGEQIRAWTLQPESNAKHLPDYIPTAIKEDYYEACLIAEKSPKASATLSRRCLQGMIRDFWSITNNRLIDEINALEEKVDNDTWESIKAVKDVGNIGAHMEKDIDHIVEVDPDEAQLLIEMIEQLIGDWYVQRFEREQRTKRVTELARAKKKQKQEAKKPAEPGTDFQ